MDLRDCRHRPVFAQAGLAGVCRDFSPQQQRLEM